MRKVYKPEPVTALPPRRRRAKYTDFLNKLRRHPKKWFVIERRKGVLNPSQTKRNHPEYDFATRKKDGVTELYCMYDPDRVKKKEGEDVGDEE